MPDTASSSTRIVDVCICTFRRPSVADLLASLANQHLPGDWRIRVTVADNDDQPTARETVERAFARNGLDGVYLHAPARNISIARNACLDAATAPLVAFIDDDERAHPDWLERLVSRLDRTGAGVVFGQVRATYAADAPDWMVKGDLHSTEAPIRQGRIDGGYTCNVLLRREAVGSARFNPAFGRTGGEDTIFFGELGRKGVAMAYAEDAVVEEPVTAARSSLEWLSKRAFRSGQSYALLQLKDGQSRPALVAKSLTKIAYCIAAAGLTIWSPVKWRKSAVRAHLHAGVLGAALGKAPLELYGAASG